MVDVADHADLPQEQRPEEVIPDELPEDRGEPIHCELWSHAGVILTYHSQPRRHSPSLTCFETMPVLVNLREIAYIIVDTRNYNACQLKIFSHIGRSAHLHDDAHSHETLVFALLAERLPPLLDTENHGVCAFMGWR